MYLPPIKLSKEDYELYLSRTKKHDEKKIRELQEGLILGDPEYKNTGTPERDIFFHRIHMLEREDEKEFRLLDSFPPNDDDRYLAYIMRKWCEGKTYDGRDMSIDPFSYWFTPDSPLYTDTEMHTAYYHNVVHAFGHVLHHALINAYKHAGSSRKKGIETDVAYQGPYRFVPRESDSVYNVFRSYIESGTLNSLDPFFLYRESPFTDDGKATFILECASYEKIAEDEYILHFKDPFGQCATQPIRMPEYLAYFMIGMLSTVTGYIELPPWSSHTEPTLNVTDFCPLGLFTDVKRNIKKPFKVYSADILYMSGYIVGDDSCVYPAIRVHPGGITCTIHHSPFTIPGTTTMCKCPTPTTTDFGMILGQYFTDRHGHNGEYLLTQLHMPSTFLDFEKLHFDISPRPSAYMGVLSDFYVHQGIESVRVSPSGKKWDRYIGGYLPFQNRYLPFVGWQKFHYLLRSFDQKYPYKKKWMYHPCIYPALNDQTLYELKNSHALLNRGKFNIDRYRFTSFFQRTYFKFGTDFSKIRGAQDSRVMSTQLRAPYARLDSTLLLSLTEKLKLNSTQRSQLVCQQDSPDFLVDSAKNYYREAQGPIAFYPDCKVFPYCMVADNNPAGTTVFPTFPIAKKIRLRIASQADYAKRYLSAIDTLISELSKEDMPCSTRQYST